MEVQAHARCKPCHASDLSCFLSCWMMPGLDRKAREGGGQGAEEEVAAGHHSGGWQSQPEGAVSSSSPWGCARGGSSVPTLGTLAPPQSSEGGQAEPQLSQGLCCPLCPGHSSHSSSPTTLDCHSLQGCPSRDGGATSLLPLLPWHPLVTAPASPRTHLGGCSWAWLEAPWPWHRPVLEVTLLVKSAEH